MGEFSSMELLLIGAVVVFVLMKVFKKKPQNEPDKYMVVQRRQTRVTNHIVKVPGKKK